MAYFGVDIGPVEVTREIILIHWTGQFSILEMLGGINLSFYTIFDRKNYTQTVIVLIKSRSVPLVSDIDPLSNFKDRSNVVVLLWFVMLLV